MDILFSVQQLHCPEESWKVKEKGRCPYTSVLIKIQLTQFIALFFLSISSVSTEQWQLYAMNMKATKIARGNPWYWWDSQLFLEKSKQKLLLMMKNPETTKSFCNNMFNKLNRFHQKIEWVNSVRKQDLCVLSKLDSISWQEMLVNFSKQWLVANTPFHETTKLLNQKGGSEEIWELDLYWRSRQAFSTSSTELKFELSPWIKTILILGSEFLMEQSNMWTIISKTTQKILQIHKKRKMYQQARQVEGKSKTSTEGIYWHDNHPTKWKNMDWYWTIKARSRVVQSLEESCQSSSTQSEVTSRRRWSNSILQDKIPSARPSSSNTKLVRWSMDSLFGCRRRTQTKISVLLWLFGINYLPPCSSRTFWEQSHWSYTTGQRVDWTWNISLHIPCRKQFQSLFNYQQWTDTWRSEFEQKTICVLLTCWSKKRRSQRSRVYRLLCTASRTILAKCMEETSRYGILGRYWSWNQRRINVLSNKIERNYSSRNTSSPLHCKSWKIEKWREIVWKAILVSSSTTEDLFETRSQLE